MTQSNLSKLTSISITQISAYENGTRNIGLQSLRKIAEATNKTMDEIYVGSGFVKPINDSKASSELIVNCISALIDEGALDYFEGDGTFGKRVPYFCSRRIFVTLYVSIIEDLVRKLIDFKKHESDYPDPHGFKKQLLAVAIKQIEDYKSNYDVGCPF